MQQTIASRHQTMDTKPHHTSRTNKRHHKKQNKNRTHSGNHKTRHARQTSTTDGGHARERTDTHNRRQHRARQKTRHARQTRTKDTHDRRRKRTREDRHTRQTANTNDRKEDTHNTTDSRTQAEQNWNNQADSVQKKTKTSHAHENSPRTNINQHQSTSINRPVSPDPTNPQTNQSTKCVCRHYSRDWLRSVFEPLQPNISLKSPSRLWGVTDGNFQFSTSPPDHLYHRFPLMA